MVEEGSRVKVYFTGRCEDGSVFDSSERRGKGTGVRLMQFTVGARETMPGIDRAVRGMALHEKKTVRIPAAEAYGEYDESLVEAVPVIDFPRAESLPVGDYIMMKTDSGMMQMKVDRIEDGMIYFDKNHRLAGHDLSFDLEIVEIVGAGESNLREEIEHGDDCGCGCRRLKRQLRGRSGDGA